MITETFIIILFSITSVFLAILLLIALRGWGRAIQGWKETLDVWRAFIDEEIKELKSSGSG